MNADEHVAAGSGEKLVDGIVNHLENAVVQAALVGEADVHAGAFTDCLEAFEFANLRRVIGLAGSDRSGECFRRIGLDI